METVQVLAVNAAVVAVCFLALWRLAVAIRDPSFVDSWWALGTVVIALSTFLQTGGRGPHALALTLLCAAWGLRLGLYLLTRWRKNGADPRYETMMRHAQEQRGWSYGKATLLLVFAIQAPLQLLVALPVQLGQIAPTDILGPVAWTGIVLAAFGIGFEALADAQLARFKADPANKGQVMDSGLWGWSRHPNYFGEACVWWGLGLIAAETGWVGAAGLIGSVAITFLLTRFSGVPTVEGRMTKKRPGYEAYKARTSPFIPMPPKRSA